MTNDIRDLFRKINQADLPYRVFQADPIVDDEPREEVPLDPSALTAADGVESIPDAPPVPAIAIAAATAAEAAPSSANDADRAMRLPRDLLRRYGALGGSQDGVGATRLADIFMAMRQASTKP